MSSSCFECTCSCCPLDLLRQGGAKHAPFNRSHYLCTHPQTNPLLVQIQHVCPTTVVCLMCIYILWILLILRILPYQWHYGYVYAHISMQLFTTQISDGKSLAVNIYQELRHSVVFCTLEDSFLQWRRNSQRRRTAHIILRLLMNLSFPKLTTTQV